ncbi:MAG TPA: extracellular solute-binding protein, partial [Candidatus Woesebacteria bacterium]|nr:extracellular solute-binding protein [Candidatus Woesebacteria bacterium]
MPDLPLPKPTSKTASQVYSSSKTGDRVRSAILGQNDADQPSDAIDKIDQPLVSQTDLSETPSNKSNSMDLLNQGSVPTEQKATGDVFDLTPPPSRAAASIAQNRSSGFVAQPPPAAVTALSSVSSNKPPEVNQVVEPELPKPESGPVRANSSLPGSQSVNDGATLQTSQAGSSISKSAPPTPPALATSQSKSEIKYARANKPRFKFLPLIIGGLVLLAVGSWLVMRFMSGGSIGSVGQTPTNNQPGSTTQNPGEGGGQTVTEQSVTLEYWGLWELESNMVDAIKTFEEQNPGIKIQYVKQSHKDYRERLQTALRSGSGPDLFRFHASWTPMFVQDLSPMPASVFSPADFKSAFYPVAAAQLQNNNQIMGIPLMYDGLVLYYNTDVFAAAGEKPPATWAELRVLAGKLTLKEGTEIKRAGAALGNATNVEHFADIIALLMVQNGADLNFPNTAEGRDALLFYTNFVTKDKVWNELMPSSTLAFARGDVAMMLAPSWRAHEIAALNPDLKFAAAPLPQLSNSRIAWASYWAEGVSEKSTYKDQAWKLLAYLSSEAGLQKMYATQ